MRRTVALFAAPVLLLAACGREPKVTVEAVGAAAAATAKAETARIAVDLGTPFGSVQGSFVGRLDGTEADGSFEALGRDISLRVVDGTVYVGMPDLPSDKRWLALSPDRLGGVGGGQGVTDALDATHLLDALRDVGDVREVGREDVDGTPTTHYAVTVDVAQAAGALGEKVDRLVGDTVPGDVWVGQDGLVRRMRFQADVAGGRDITAQVDITDVGVAVDVVAPPADQVLRIG